MQLQSRAGQCAAAPQLRRRAAAARTLRQWRCAAAPQPAGVREARGAGRLLYDAVALDMDGTLTKAHIDFVDMRKRTGIPVGDLFVAMESWEEPEEVARAMGVILEIEAEASKTVSAMPGLLELMATLRDHDVKVALVTRNTTASVDAFFRLIGEEWRPAFDAIRTREFRFVKPDKRLLLSLAEDLGARPGHMLMVGDSLEDVECGNAAGTATCLIAGGGNEVGATNAAPPPGAVATITVHSLQELNEILLRTRQAGDSTDDEDAPLLGWRARAAGAEDPAAVAAELAADPLQPGAPAPGLDFADYLIGMNALCIATTSFPRMGAAAGGLQACPVGGHSVLHLQCGGGALTKMLASKGLRVCGADADVAAATKRGLRCFPYGGGGSGGGALAGGALAAAAGAGPYDVAIFHQPGGSAGMRMGDVLARGTLDELRAVLAADGRLCAEADGMAAGDAAAALQAAGWRADKIEAGPGGRLRVVAQVA
ncbi:MAG: HAD-like domain-containing protein [Monoraphidium minutum]|nr:MAG: HAD-like domain-containing protein [Monoraphidium minutum]